MAEVTPVGWIGDATDVFEERISPAEIGRARIVVSNRSALKGVSLYAPALEITQAVLDDYDTASAKLASAAAKNKGCTLSAGEWRALLAFQSMGHALLAHSGALPWVPDRMSEVREARAKAGASSATGTPEERAFAAQALPDLTHGLFVADVRGISHKDPTVAQVLKASRGAIALLKKSAKVSTPSADSISRAELATFQDGTRAVTVTDLSGGVETIQIGAAPGLDRAAFPILGALAIGGAIVIAAGGIWAWRDTAKYEIAQKNAGPIAAAGGVVQATILDAQQAQKEGRPVNPGLIAALNKIATVPSDAADWTAPLLTFGLGGVVALGAGWALRRLIRGGRR